ncbi:hypothetical protein GIX45_07510 [Erwinia sp. CPCC 100877]|nr:hypothetical protein [Erwinia sp. CPCC 100877]
MYSLYKINECLVNADYFLFFVKIFSFFFNSKPSSYCSIIFRFFNTTKYE